MFNSSFLVMSIALLWCVFEMCNGFFIEPGYQWFSRADWDAEPATDVRPLKLPVPYLVVHHTYIPAACNATAQCKAAMRSMQRYHNSLHWGDIGYNFCVGSEGGIYEGRGWSSVGIHAGKANNYSLGICLIGDWRVEVPPPIQLEATKALISHGLSEGILAPDYKLISHKQVMATECPGDALQGIISTWNHFEPHPDFSQLAMEKLKIKDNVIHS